MLQVLDGNKGRITVRIADEDGKFASEIYLSGVLDLSNMSVPTAWSY